MSKSFAPTFLYVFVADTFFQFFNKNQNNDLNFFHFWQKKVK
ncbi:hypothetical protein RV17_GL001468 [Enterococcus thailandicus]|nr:hypothetical protein RV17_GL001468 [Enterococcus thailandicus]